MEANLQRFLDTMNKKGDVIVPSSGPGGYLKRITFGNMLLDVASNGGAPQGKIIRFYGPLSGGKTQAALRVFASNQNKCHHCWEEKEVCVKAKKHKYKKFRLAYIDLENSWDPDWSELNGIEVNRDPESPNVLVSVPESSEQAMDVVDSLIRLRLADVIIFDSIAQAVPSIELNKSLQEYVGGKVGAHSLIMNAAMRKWQHGLATKMKEPAPLVIAINQERETLDPYNPTTQPGGKGQGFASAFDVVFTRLKYRTDKGKIKGLREFAPDKGDPVAQLQRFHVDKSKICPSGRVGEFWSWQANDPEITKTPGDISYGPSLFGYAIRFGVIEKIEGEYVVTPTGETLGKSKEKVEAFLTENRDTQDEIAEYIRERASNGNRGSAVVDEKTTEAA